MIDSWVLLEIEIGGCMGGNSILRLHHLITTAQTSNDVNSAK